MSTITENEPILLLRVIATMLVDQGKEEPSSEIVDDSRENWAVAQLKLGFKTPTNYCVPIEHRLISGCIE